MDTYTGNILDPIHGLIKLSEIEKWILSQKIFNRLRRVKQNTFLYLIFPSANHTRFEHSIGVMHLAHQIYINANENFETGNFKRQKYNIDQTKDFKFVSTKDIKDEKLLVQELRLAALLHDIGHGPMSHKFDQYTITGKQLINILKKDRQFDEYIIHFKNLITEDKKIDHEIVSCVFIIKLISQLKELANSEKFNSQKEIIEKLDINRIIKMIEPKFNPQEKIIIEDVDYTPFYNSIISSFPIDADRMDYLYRDSYFSGVKYGLYDLSRLLMSFIPIKQENTVSLCIKESGIDSIIRFIQSRTHLYTQVYFHKTNRAANAMLDYACKDIKDDESIITAKKYIDFEEFYWNNSDELFLWNTLKEKINGDRADVLDELLNRKLWKRVHQDKIVRLPIQKNNDTNIEEIKANEEKIENHIEEIKAKASNVVSKLKEKDIDVFFDFVSNEVFKDYKKSKIKIARKIDSDYIIEDDWKNFNEELKVLDYEIFMIRIYLRRKFNSPSEFNSQKEVIKTYFENIFEDLKILNKLFLHGK